MRSNGQGAVQLRFAKLKGVLDQPKSAALIRLFFMKNLFEKLHEIDARLPVMILDLVAKRKKFSGRVEESSFFRIPSVKSFSVKPGEENLLLQGSGLERKLPSSKTWELLKEQERLNKYMKARIRSMKAVLRAGKPEIFWAMVERDMKRSTAFRLSAINSVIHG
jgi:hypothetical protein